MRKSTSRCGADDALRGVFIALAAIATATVRHLLHDDFAKCSMHVARACFKTEHACMHACTFGGRDNVI